MTTNQSIGTDSKSDLQYSRTEHGSVYTKTYVHELHNYNNSEMQELNTASALLITL